MDKTKVIEVATKYVQKGQLDKAIREYQKLVEADPRDIRGWQKLAELYQKKGDNHEAANTFLKVAESYSEQGFFLKAVAVYKQILKIDPDLIDVNVKLAELYKQLGLVGEAMGQFQVVASYYEKVGNARESLATLKKIVELDPDNSAAQRRLAEMYAREGMNTEAAAAFARSAEQLKRAGRIEDWLKVAERLLQLTPDDMLLTRDVAKVYLEKGDTKRALARLQTCFKANPRDVKTLELLGRSFEALGQSGKTVSVYKELAKIHAEAKKTTEAERMWRRVLDLAPDDAEAQSALGLGAGPAIPEPSRPRPAASAPPSPPARAPAPPPPATWEEKPAAGKLPPEQVARLLTETDVYLKYGLHEKALEHLKKVYAADPENIPAHEKARDSYLRQNHIAAAAEEVASLVPLLAAAGQVDEARHNLERLKVMAPDHPRLPEFLALLSGATQGGEEEVLEEAAVETVDEPIDLAGEEAEAEEVEPEAIAEEEMEVIEDEAILEDEDAMLAEAEAAGKAAATIAAEAEIGAEQIADADGADVDVSSKGARAAAADMGALAAAAFDVGEELVEEDEDVTLAEGEDEPVEVLATGPVAVVDEADDDLAAVVAAKAEDDIVDESAEAEVAPTFKPPASPPAPAAEVEGRPPAAPPPAPPPIAEDDEYAEELAEADFFMQEGMAEDAREILEGILLADPEHAGATARLAALSAPPAAPAQAALAAATVDQSFDLARELAEELGQEDTQPDAMEDFQYSVEDVFSEFKKGVERTIAQEDADTHYDLGIAYKEMGLLDDAVHEFELALKGKGKKSKADYLLVLGMTLAEKGDLAAAVERFEQALATPGIAAEVAKGVHFEIAAALEAKGDFTEAVKHYATVMRADAGYRNVKEALARAAKAAESASKNGGDEAPRKIGYV